MLEITMYRMHLSISPFKLIKFLCFYSRLNLLCLFLYKLLMLLFSFFQGLGMSVSLFFQLFSQLCNAIPQTFLLLSRTALKEGKLLEGIKVKVSGL